MSELPDRVASAVARCIVACGLIKHPADSPWVVGPSILIARAAIEAMREPTREMRHAGAEAEFWPRSLGGEASACVGQDRADAAWRAMIAIALAPDQPSMAPQPHDPPAADDASGMTKDQEIADLKRLLSLSKERLPSPKARGVDLSLDGGDWRNYPEAP